MRAVKSVIFQNNEKRNFITAAIILFISFLLLYFSFGLLISKTISFTVSGVLFETDTPRVINDMTDFSADHYRTKVHPLYVLITNPVGSLLSGIIDSKPLTAIILNSFFGAVGILLAFIYFHLKTTDLVSSLLLASFFGLTSSQFFLSAIPETVSLAVCSLLVTYIIFVIAIRSGRVNFPVWILAGIFTLAITITNFAQTLICFFIASLIHAFPGKKNSFFYAVGKTVLFLLVVIFCAMALSLFQKSIYPSSRLFYTLEYYEEETLYTSFAVLTTPIPVISELLKHFFLVNIIAPFPSVFQLHVDALAVTFSRSWSYSLIGWTAVALWFYMLAKNLIQVFRSKEAEPLKIGFAFTLCLFFNLALHSIYGFGSNGGPEYFLYTGNFTFLVTSFLALTPPSSGKFPRILLTLLVILTGMNNLMTFMNIINIYS